MGGQTVAGCSGTGCRDRRADDSNVFRSQFLSQNDRIVAATNTACRDIKGQTWEGDQVRAGGHQGLPNDRTAAGARCKGGRSCHVRTSHLQGIKRTIATASCASGRSGPPGPGADCVCGPGKRRDEMIQPNGQNGNGSTATIQEPAARETVIGAPAVGDALEQGPELATRAKQRAKQQIQQNRFVIIGAGAIVVALLIFVATSMPSKRPAPKSKNGDRRHAGRGVESSATPGDKSLFPITDSGRPAAKETHEGFLNERDLQRTATGRPSSGTTTSRTGKYGRNASFNTALRRAAELASSALSAWDKRKQCG